MGRSQKMTKENKNDILSDMTVIMSKCHLH